MASTRLDIQSNSTNKVVYHYLNPGQQFPLMHNSITYPSLLHALLIPILKTKQDQMTCLSIKDSQVMSSVWTQLVEKEQHDILSRIFYDWYNDLLSGILPFQWDTSVEKSLKEICPLLTKKQMNVTKNVVTVKRSVRQPSHKKTMNLEIVLVTLSFGVLKQNVHRQSTVKDWLLKLRQQYHFMEDEHEGQLVLPSRNLLDMTTDEILSWQALINKYGNYEDDGPFVIRVIPRTSSMVSSVSSSTRSQPKRPIVRPNVYRNENETKESGENIEDIPFQNKSRYEKSLECFRVIISEIGVYLSKHKLLDTPCIVFDIQYPSFREEDAMTWGVIHQTKFKNRRRHDVHRGWNLCGKTFQNIIKSRQPHQLKDEDTLIHHYLLTRTISLLKHLFVNQLQNIDSFLEYSVHDILTSLQFDFKTIPSLGEVSNELTMWYNGQHEDSDLFSKELEYPKNLSMFIMQKYLSQYTLACQSFWKTEAFPAFLAQLYPTQWKQPFSSKDQIIENVNQHLQLICTENQRLELYGLFENVVKNSTSFTFDDEILKKKVTFLQKTELSSTQQQEITNYVPYLFEPTIVIRDQGVLATPHHLPQELEWLEHILDISQSIWNVRHDDISYPTMFTYVMTRYIQYWSSTSIMETHHELSTNWKTKDFYLDQGIEQLCRMYTECIDKQVVSLVTPLVELRFEQDTFFRQLLWTVGIQGWTQVVLNHSTPCFHVNSKLSEVYTSLSAPNESNIEYRQWKWLSSFFPIQEISFDVLSVLFQMIHIYVEQRRVWNQWVSSLDRRHVSEEVKEQLHLLFFRNISVIPMILEIESGFVIHDIPFSIDGDGNQFLVKWLTFVSTQYTSQQWNRWYINYTQRTSSLVSPTTQDSFDTWMNWWWKILSFVPTKIRMQSKTLEIILHTTLLTMGKISENWSIKSIIKRFRSFEFLPKITAKQKKGFIRSHTLLYRFPSTTRIQFLQDLMTKPDPFLVDTLLFKSIDFPIQTLQLVYCIQTCATILLFQPCFVQCLRLDV